MSILRKETAPCQKKKNHAPTRIASAKIAHATHANAPLKSSVSVSDASKGFYPPGASPRTPRRIPARHRPKRDIGKMLLFL